MSYNMSNFSHYLLLSSFGFLAMLAFFSRFFVQWIQSERRKQSRVTKSFWRISLIGNVLMLIHFLIQIQYHLFFIQTLNAITSHRQLRLMNKNAPNKKISEILTFIALAIVSMTALFSIRAFVQFAHFDWIHLPALPFRQQSIREVSFSWHMFGFLSASLFAGRFWIQWWFSEKDRKSNLSPTFWWLSLSGALLTLCYAVYIRDVILTLSHCAGMIPYIRNLMLINKAQKIRS